jgi:hypothetical protein
MRHATRLGESEASYRVIFYEDSDGADSTSTEAEVSVCEIEHDAFGVSNLGSDLFGLGQVAAADQQRKLGVGNTKILGSKPANDPGTAREENGS